MAQAKKTAAKKAPAKKTAAKTTAKKTVQRKNVEDAVAKSQDQVKEVQVQAEADREAKRKADNEATRKRLEQETKDKEAAEKEAAKATKAKNKLKDTLDAQFAEIQKTLTEAGKSFDKEPRPLKLAKRTLDGAKEAADRFVRLHG